MKIIHAADLHLGSRIGNEKFKDIRETIKKNVVNAFNNMIEYAKENNIHVILLSGDVFDSDHPSGADQKFFYNAIKNNPEIDFYYLRGNHDLNNSSEQFDFPNLKTFSDNWTSYELDSDITVSGIEITNDNYLSLYSKLNLVKEKFNIVMLHGQDSNISDVCSLNISKLRGKNIDYLALGHIHGRRTFNIDDRAKGIYPGNIAGRGFDELSEKGFVVINIDNKKYSTEFVKCSNIEFIEDIVDASNTTDEYNLIDLIKSEVKDENNKIIRVHLKGEIDYETPFVQSTLVQDYKNVLYIEVVDDTKKIIHIDEYLHDKSFKGYFVRNVYDSPDLSDEEKSEIIRLGLHLLKGEEIN